MNFLEEISFFMALDFILKYKLVYFYMALNKSCLILPRFPLTVALAYRLELHGFSSPCPSIDSLTVEEGTKTLSSSLESNLES